MDRRQFLLRSGQLFITIYLLHLLPPMEVEAKAPQGSCLPMSLPGGLGCAQETQPGKGKGAGHDKEKGKGHDKGRGKGHISGCSVSG